jgi:hypothetical protein
LLTSRLSGEARSILGRIETGEEEYGRLAALAEATFAETTEEMVEHVLGEIAPVSEESELYNKAHIWSTHAFLGGRIELAKQGRNAQNPIFQRYFLCITGSNSRTAVNERRKMGVCQNPTGEQI